MPCRMQGRPPAGRGNADRPDNLLGETAEVEVLADPHPLGFSRTCRV